ncbi:MULTISPECIES: cytosine permease [unclassified Pseudomonas]|uniref:cytosine permease n=1 Tax=unclassified Pseudomonas TaxID=196821 RepID=UPI001CC0B503|nr:MULTISPECIES: cytosine permease [unclassified Pseudomonas]
MSRMSRQDPLIENHTVDYVPLAERHGKARDLFTLWFSTNIAPLPIVTGAMVVQVFHLNLFWGLLAIALGHMVGGVVIALASAQGPCMGIPQMVQSRGQFGRYGALLIVFFAALIYIGFFISNIVLAGCCVVALGASANFISQFIGLILALLLVLLVLVPWASINLIDFYLIKRGRYDIASIFRADGGIYGRFNLHAIIAYFIGIIVQLPFANTSLYVGPYANLVDGADLSWLVGLVVTCPLYYCLATRSQSQESRSVELGYTD